MAQLAVQQLELQYAREALQRAEARIVELETQIRAITGESSEFVQENSPLELQFQAIRALELQIVQSKNEASRFEAELNAHRQANSQRMEWAMFEVKVVLATAILAFLLTIATFVVAILAT